MAFIVFEGLDASGKSTLMKKVGEELTKRSITFEQVRDPGSTELGEEVRHLLLRPEGEAPCPEAEILLYEAARAQMVQKKIRPALEASKWVLSDRFTSSTLAFQAFARGLDHKQVEDLNAFATQGCEPDLFVLLDISLKESHKRKLSRSQAEGAVLDRMELEASQFQEKVRQGYLSQAKEKPQQWLVLDATDSPQALCHSFFQEVQRRKWLA